MEEFVLFLVFLLFAYVVWRCVRTLRQEAREERETVASKKTTDEATGVRARRLRRRRKARAEIFEEKKADGLPAWTRSPRSCLVVGFLLGRSMGAKRREAEMADDESF